MSFDPQELIDEFGYNDGMAVAYMLRSGYCLQNDKMWLKPAAYHVPTAKEWRALEYLQEAHGYKGLSVDIKKPIRKMCELEASELLRCHMKLRKENYSEYDGQGGARIVGITGRRYKPETTKKGSVRKKKSRVQKRVKNGS